MKQEKNVMILQCKNCHRFYKGLYKLRRHYLSYLPYFFGSYICVICELSFDSELKLLSHILKKQHTEQNDSNFIIQTQRENYLKKTNNKYFGTRCLQFNDEDIIYFIHKKSVSNFDLRPAVEAVINIENSDLVINIDQNNSNVPNTMELNKFYEVVTPTGNTFEENIIPPQDNCTLPSPPINRPNKKRHTIPDSRVTRDITLGILEQRLNNLELKIDTVENKISTEIKQAKDEVISKIESSMSYNRQLYHAVTTQFREMIIDLLSKSSQASLDSLRTQSSSNRR